MRFGARRLAVLPVVVLVVGWRCGVAQAEIRGEVRAKPTSPVGAKAAAPTTVATTSPLIANPIGPATYPLRPASEAPHLPFSPLAPLAPFGPFKPRMPEPPRPAAPPGGPLGGPRPGKPPPLGPVPIHSPEIPESNHELPVERVGPPLHPPPVRMITLPDGVVLKAMDTGRGAFLHCWARAARSVPEPSSNKVRLHIELDAAGKIIHSQSDTDSPVLARCLDVVAHQLQFPAPGQPAVVDLPLMFR